MPNHLKAGCFAVPQKSEVLTSETAEFIYIPPYYRAEVRSHVGAHGLSPIPPTSLRFRLRGTSQVETPWRDTR